MHIIHYITISVSVSLSFNTFTYFPLLTISSYGSLLVHVLYSLNISLSMSIYFSVHVLYSLSISISFYVIYLCMCVLKYNTFVFSLSRLR